MKRSAVRTGFLALCFIASTATADEWSDATAIVGISVIEGLRVLRLQILPVVPNSNPGGCTANDFIDVQLGTDTSETQQLMHNAIQVAFLTKRTVQLYLRSDRCSTAGTSLALRVAAGVRVSN